MSRFLASIAATTVLAASGVAQCADVSAPGAFLGTGDDFLSGHIPLGFTFTMNGQYGALAPYTHFRACTNGWVALTNGVVNSGLPLATDYGGIANITSIAGGAPRVMPFFGDEECDATGGVYFKTVPGVSCTISWVQMHEWEAVVGSFPDKNMTCTLFATGVIKFAYSTGFNLDDAPGHSPVKYVAVSPGNGIGVPAQSDFAVNGASASNIVYEAFNTEGGFDIGSKEITFTPNGGGGWTWATTCEGAHHTTYNKGCYNQRQTFYETFGDAGAASLGLPGNVIMLTNTGTGYLATWLPGSAGALYVPPSGSATSLTPNDDGNDTITPSVALTVPGGSEPSLTISHNGIITCGGVSNNAGDYSPTGAELSSALSRAFYAWHDFNDQDTGSGVIKYEEATIGPAQVLYITWDDVDMWPNGISHSNTLQFQINLTSGDVAILWTVVDPDSSSIYGSSHVVGYTGPLALSDPGSQTLSVALPQIVYDIEVVPLTLSATPAPTFTLGGSSVPISWTTDNLVDLSPVLPGVYLAALAFSINVPPPGPGFDLTFIGLDAPGCDLNISTIDVYLPINPVSASHSQVIAVPQPLGVGDTFYCQSVNFFIPNSLPNGMNGVGVITSNGVKSYFQTF